MGIVISARKYSSANKTELLRPIIFHSPPPELEEQAVSLNKPLAEQLVEYKPGRRTMQIEKWFKQVLATLSDEVTIMDFDVLFNADYKIDVLQMMVNVYRTRPFSVIWPGKFKDGKLYYAEEGYLDYKIYYVDKHDVTCVI